MEYKLVAIESTVVGTIFEQAVNVFEQASIHFPDIIRMWIGLGDIDDNYQDFSAARNQVYEKYGYHKGVRTFVSTCVGSVHRLRMSLLLAPGIDRSKIVYADLKSLIPHTNVYGVSFERACRVEYRDGCFHHFISGTASMDESGNIMHIGDAVKQVRRIWKIIGGLLESQQASLKDISSIMCYVRNEEDMDAVKSEMNHMGFISPNMDVCFSQACICRKDWLVECECVAET
jgi:enamine deaminase RidA (YjgF/YER057c/UK114 family)